jgi:hypothetical protein
MDILADVLNTLEMKGWLSSRSSSLNHLIASAPTMNAVPGAMRLIE